MTVRWLAIDLTVFTDPFIYTSFWLGYALIRVSNHYISGFSVLLASIEAAALLAVFFAGAAIRFMQWDVPVSGSLISQLPGAVTFTFVILASMAALGMYQLDGRQDFEGILLRLLPSLALGFGFITLIFYLFPDLYFGRGLLAIVMLLALLLILIIRLLFFQVVRARQFTSPCARTGCRGKCRRIARSH